MTGLQKKIWFILPVLSGGILALVFYFPKLSLLLFVGFLPVVFFLDRLPSIKAGLLAGLLLGFVYYSTSILGSLWPSHEAQRFIVGELAGTTNPQLIIVLQVLAFMALSVWFSLPYVLWGGAGGQAIKRGFMASFSLPALWVLTEFLRRKLFFDLSWGDIGYNFTDYPVIALTARLWGKYGLAFAVMLVNILIYRLISGPKRQLAAAGLILIAAGVTFTGLTLRAADQAGSTGEARVVAVLQGYLPWDSRVPEDPTKPFSFPEPYSRMLAALEAGGRRIDIVVLPEEIIHEYPVAVAADGYPAAVTDRSGFWQSEQAEISRQISDLGASALIVGQPTFRDERFFNGLFVFERQGTVGIYSKRRLFPFVEYMPLPFRSFRQSAAYTPGTSSPLVPTSAGNLLVISCIEIENDAIINRFLGDQPSLIVAGGSEIGFREAARRYQMQLARFRAIEQDRYVVRATKRGWSVIADPMGKVVSSVDKSSSDEALVSQVYLRGGRTLFNRTGDMPLVIASLFLALIAFRPPNLRRS